MSRTWVAQPETADESVLAATGRGYDAWCDLIDRMDGDTSDHTAVAAYLTDEHRVDPWWAQTITVGYERITGRRLPNQRRDETFTATKSRVVSSMSAAELRSRLLDDADRTELFGDVPAELRSDPEARTIRIAIGPGVATLGVSERADGRTHVAIQHDKLPAPEMVDDWKAYWADWLDRLDGRPTD